MAPVLGYWNLHALAEPIRFMLHYVGADFEEKRYNFGTFPNLDRSEWLNEKFTHGLDFPNLPYYIDGEIKLTQSKAIIRYLGRKHGLAAKSEEEQRTLDMLEGVIGDLYDGVSGRKLLFEKDIEGYKKEYSKTAGDKLKQLSGYLAKKKYLLGDRITYVDFLAYDTLYLHRVLCEDLLAPYPNLKDYLTRIGSQEGLRKYMDSETYRRPLWAK